MLNTGQPINELGKLERFGTPFHGLFQDGYLTLPSGALKVYPQSSEFLVSPTQLAGHRPGDTAIVRMPGHVFTRTPAEVLVDQAKDHEWLSYGVISGRERHFYGKSLGQRGWLYCVAASEVTDPETGVVTPVPSQVWHIEMTAQLGNGGKMRFDISRYTATKQASGVGHTASVFVDMPGGHGVTIGRLQSMETELCGHSGAGDVLAVGLALPQGFDPDAGPFDRTAPYPEAFLKLEVSGQGTADDIVIGASVYISRSTAMRTYVSNDVPVVIDRTEQWYLLPRCTDYLPLLTDAEVFKGETPWTFRRLSPTAIQVPYGDPLTQFSGEDSPSGSPGQPVIARPRYGATNQGSTNGGAFVPGIGHESSFKTSCTANRIFWVFVDEAGAFSTVETEVHYEIDRIDYRYSSSSTSSTENGTQAGYSDPGSINGGAWTDSVFFKGEERKYSMRVKIDGGIVDSWDAHYKYGDDITSRRVHRSYGDFPPNLVTQAESKTMTINGATVSDFNLPIKGISDINLLVLNCALNSVFFANGDSRTPYVYLYTNNIVGIIEGNGPQIRGGGTGDGITRYFLIDVNRYQRIFAADGSAIAGPSASGFLYASWEPVKGIATTHQSTPCVYL
jgi:hypothetical protein